MALQTIVSIVKAGKVTMRKSEFTDVRCFYTEPERVVMPEYLNLLKDSHANYFNVLRDHHPNVFRRS
jgi:hypothetical protein